jgi:glycosyltransferase involved in cell wall biosynthesis
LSGGSLSTVFGLPVHNAESHLAESLESLLDQTRRDFAIVVVDDCSTDRTSEIALSYVQLDPRVVYERNERQLGLVLNWRRAFERAGERFPSARYFAWASDHDVWHARWLEALAAELDAHPQAVLAYPFFVRIDDAGAEYPTREQHFDTSGVAEPGERARRVARGLTTAGELIYGLVRRDALERCGPFPLVVLPDRLHLLRLAVEGEFRQVPRRLWYRRYRAGVAASNRRQRRSSFRDGVPLSAYAPWWVAHPQLLSRSLVGHPERRRLARAALVDSLLHAYERRRERVGRRRRWLRRRVRRALGGLRPARRPLPPPVEPGRDPLDAALGALERAELLDGLAAEGATIAEVGGSGLADRLRRAYPGLVAWEGGDRVDLLVSVGGLEGGVPPGLPPARYLYSFDREHEGVRAALARDYWLRELWVPLPGEPKPDPLQGPVPRVAGRERHLLGRRRLLVAPR